MYIKMNQNFVDHHGLVFDLVINGDGKGNASIIAAAPIPMFDICKVLPDVSCLPQTNDRLTDTQYTCSYEWENGQFKLLGFFYRGWVSCAPIEAPGVKCEIMQLENDSKGNVDICYLIDDGVYPRYSGTFLMGSGYKKRYYPRFDTMTAVPCEPKCFRELYEVVFENGQEISRNPISRWDAKIREYVKSTR